jgi:hypothetical protein
MTLVVMTVRMMLMSPRIGKLILYFVPLGSWCRFVVVGGGEEGVCIYYALHSCIPVVVVLPIWTIFPTFHMFCTVLYSPECILS